MVDISPELHSLPRPSSINAPTQSYTPPYFKEIVIRCEDCPSSKVCKQIGNFRPTCDTHTIPPGHNHEYSTAKCIAGTNILLAKLLEKTEKGF